ncbi:MAG: flagellar filament capping protein FliD [Tepidisphaeraceae bacterium]
MGRISTDVGLVSGINKRDIIDQLMSLESRPKELLQDRIDQTNDRRLAYTDISTRLTSLRITGTKLKKPSTFESATAASSNEDVLTATAANGAAVGSFQFQVARLVTSQQTVSKGFADVTTQKVGAGTLTIEQGGGELSSQTPLAQLNGGAGVRRGMFRITDRSGATSVIDVSAAVSMDDVIKKINTSLEVNVRATLDGDRVVLTDRTGQTTTAVTVQDLADGHTAEDLGLTSDTDAVATTITGKDINFLGPLTTLSQLNDSRGVRQAPTGADLIVTLGDGSAVDVTLGADVKTMGGVIDAINAASPTKMKADLVPGGNGIKLTDLTGGGGAFSVADATGSKAATDLGLTATSAGGVINGSPVLADINTVLLSSLNGGSGIALATLTITDRAGGNATINLAGAKTVQDVLDTISDAAGVNVTARLKSSGNGIQIVDDTGASGNLVIAAGATADALGIAGTFDATVTAVDGKNLQRQWVTENTLLSTYNGGKGVSPGKFKITNAAGVAATIDLTKGDKLTIGDVIAEINEQTGVTNITASINGNGDGLLLTDATVGGALKMKVEDLEGTAAADLKIKGDATLNTIDGTFEKTIEILATDTLTDVQTKVNNLGFGAGATVVNDGTGLTPFRLSLNARNTGRAGRIVFDAGTTALNTNTLVESQDAAVFVGGAEAKEPLLVTASQNQLTGVVKGVTIDLHGVSASPVTLNISRNVDSVIEQLNTFTESFNEMVTKIRDLTKFDTETNERGLLLGDSSIQKVENEIYAMLRAVVPNAGRYRILAEVGMKVSVDIANPKDGAKLTFDEEKFRQAYATDPDAVKSLFTAPEQGLTTRTLLDGLNSGRGVRTAGSGADFRATLKDNSTIDVSLAGAETIGDVINAINAAGTTKLKAELMPNGGLKLTDLTTGATPFKLDPQNGSQALTDLLLANTAVGAVATGASLGSVGDPLNRGGGIGYNFENRIMNLIDPVRGVIPRENRTLDERAQQFQGRIDNLDKLLTSKRERLERQFAQLESVLSSLQNQQQAIGQIQSIQMPSSRN